MCSKESAFAVPMEQYCDGGPDSESLRLKCRGSYGFTSTQPTSGGGGDGGDGGCGGDGGDGGSDGGCDGGGAGGVMTTSGDETSIEFDDTDAGSIEKALYMADISAFVFNVS